MTVESSLSKVVFNGNGVTTEFPFTFKVWDVSEIAVTMANPQGYAEDVTAAAVITLDEDSGGAVTYLHEGAPLPEGWRLAITRNMPFLQRVDLVSATRFDPQVMEDALDQACAERQELREKVDRAVLVDATDARTPAEYSREFWAAHDDVLTARDNVEEMLRETGTEVGTHSYVTSSGSTTARTLGDRFADVINVKDFGAKGDGETDDMSAFAAAETSGKPIFVPEGEYKIGEDNISYECQLTKCNTQTNADSAWLRCIYDAAVKARHKVDDLRWKTINRHVDYDRYSESTEYDSNRSRYLNKDPSFPFANSLVTQQEINDTAEYYITIIIRDMVRKEIERASGGRRTIIRGAGGYPNVMYILPKFRLCDVGIGSNKWHPAFIVNDKLYGEIFIGCYLASLVGGYAVSRPQARPLTRAFASTMDALGHEAGNGFHCMTAAEWGALALVCSNAGYEPRGNNKYGQNNKALYETAKYANPIYHLGTSMPIISGAGGGTLSEPTLTGTGPISWNHDGSADGIADICGNLLEYQPGLCLKYGEIQVIPDNNAALSAVDKSEDSTAWKAIAAGEENELVTSIVTATRVNQHVTVTYSRDDTLKINCINYDPSSGGEAQIDTIITQYSDPDAMDAGAVVGKYAIARDFRSLTKNSNNIPIDPVALQALAMFPSNNSGITHQKGTFYTRNWMPHDTSARGGNWYWTDSAAIGMFSQSLTNRRNVMGYPVGFRLAYIAL